MPGVWRYFLTCRECTATACNSPSARLAGPLGNKCSLPERLFDRLPVSLVETTHSEPITQFVQLLDSKAPAGLIAYTVSADAVLRESVIENRSKGVITGYQLGWLVASQKHGPTIEVGSFSKLDQPLEPGKTGTIAEQRFSPTAFDNDGGLKRIGFFIVSVRFADGTSWHADRKKLKQRGKFPVSKVTPGKTTT